MLWRRLVRTLLAGPIAGTPAPVDTGTAASLAGRPFSFSSMGTGPGEFEVDGKQE